jgi:hypothetical protein
MASDFAPRKKKILHFALKTSVLSDRLCAWQYPERKAHIVCNKKSHKWIKVNQSLYKSVPLNMAIMAQHMQDIQVHITCNRARTPK